MLVVSMTGPKPSSISTLTRELKSSGGSISSSSDWFELKLKVGTKLTMVNKNKLINLICLEVDVLA